MVRNAASMVPTSSMLSHYGSQSINTDLEFVQVSGTLLSHDVSYLGCAEDRGRFLARASNWTDQFDLNF